MKEGGVINACICMGTHSLSYRTDWWMLTKFGRDEIIMARHALRLFGQIRPEVDPGRRKNRSMRGSFSKRLLLEIGMQQQQTECILVSWIEISRLFAVRCDFTNFLINHLLRNLNFNRSNHCTKVGNQCPFGALVSLGTWWFPVPPAFLSFLWRHAQSLNTKIFKHILLMLIYYIVKRMTTD